MHDTDFIEKSDEEWVVGHEITMKNTMNYSMENSMNGWGVRFRPEWRVNTFTMVENEKKNTDKIAV